MKKEMKNKSHSKLDLESLLINNNETLNQVQGDDRERSTETRRVSLSPSSRSVSVRDIGRFFIPRTTTLRGDGKEIKNKVIPEICNRESQPCIKTKWLRSPTETLGDDGVCTVEVPDYKLWGRRCIKAFTLIEVLVVVLIIGILAAVALPQYTMAVNKTRFANLRTLAITLARSAEEYYLANNEYPSSFDEIALNLPANFTTAPVANNATCGTNNEIYCCIIPKSLSWSQAISCGRKDYSFAVHHMMTVPSKTYCIANKIDSNAIKLCKSFSLAVPISWGVMTPDGRKSSEEFDYYEMES